MFSLPLLSLLLATGGFATPLFMGRDGPVPASALNFPCNRSQLVAPTSAPKFVAVGVGNQNYTCTAGGNYTSIGAVAQLFDITPLFGTSEFSTIQNDALSVWTNSPDTDPLGSALAAVNGEFGIDLLGIHDFVNFTGKLSPKFDFTQTTSNPNDFVITAKTGDIPSPTPGNDVDWLQLMKVDGGLANQVFRVDTAAGKPPSTCTPGSGVLTVKYAAKYFFF